MFSQSCFLPLPCYLPGSPCTALSILPPAAFNIFTGVWLGSINTTAINTTTTSDNFVSSPTLTSDARTLFVHSSSGTLWRVAITGDVTSTVTFSLVWACDYYISGPSPKCDTVVVPPTPPALDGWYPESRSVAGGSEGDEYVSGGFYQPTTRRELDELRVEVLGEWVRVTGRDASLAPTPLSKQMVDLPLPVIGSIVTPSGYCLLDTDGVPVVTKLLRTHALTSLASSAHRAPKYTGIVNTQRPLSRFMLGGILPFATPSLSAGDATVMIAQYAAFGGDSAVFAVNPTNGNQLWYLQNITSVDNKTVPFGRSRSSPAIDQNGNICE